jgi:hypothetical protein
VAVLLAKPELVGAAGERIPLDWLEDERARAILRALVARGTEGRTKAELAALADDEVARRAAAEVLSSLEERIDYAAEWPGLVARLEARALARRKRELPPAERCSDEEFAKLIDIQRRLKAGK